MSLSVPLFQPPSPSQFNEMGFGFSDDFFCVKKFDNNEADTNKPEPIKSAKSGGL